MKGIGTLSVWNCDVLMKGVGALSLNQPHYGETLMAAESFLYATVSAAIGQANLPALRAIGGDYNYAGSSADQHLRPLVSSAAGGFYVPAEPVTGYGNLPPITAAGMGKAIGKGTGSVSLPAMTALGGDYSYAGTSNQQLPPLFSFGLYGVSGEASMISSSLAHDNMTFIKESLVIITSTGLVSDVYTADKVIIAEILSDMLAQDEYTAIGIFNIDILTEIFGETLLTGAVTVEEGEETGPGGPGAALDDSRRVWVINLDTGASTQYENYGFTSFFTENGINYGVADDGIYQLDGDNDAGRYIDALANFGRSNFGTSEQKKIPNIYLGVSSDENMYLKVDADEQVYVYELRSNSDELKVHRADTGRGLKGNFWNLTAMNKRGSDFVLATVQFDPVPLSRKI